MSDVRVGLVGCGRLAEVGYLPALRAADGVRLVAVADPDPLRRRHAAGDLPAFDTAASLLAHTTVDALVLATPAAAHLPDARLAAAAGVRALIEKPPAPDAAEAAELAALTPVPSIAFNRRFAPGPAALRHAIPSTGRLDLVLELRYRRRVWGAHTVGDEALLDLGAHLVDLARWLSGTEPVGVRHAVVSHERAEFELLGNRGCIQVRCATDQRHVERFEARGEGGVVLAAHREGGVRDGVRARLMARSAPHPLAVSLRRQLEAFAATVGGTSDPVLATAADGLAAMTILGAVRACADDGGRRVDLTVAP